MRHAIATTVRMRAPCPLSHRAGARTLRSMRLDTKPGLGHQHHGEVYRVLRNGAEVSAWSSRPEAEGALADALAAEAADERARLPANSAAGLEVTASAITFSSGGAVMWRAEYTLDRARGPRAVLTA